MWSYINCRGVTNLQESHSDHNEETITDIDKDEEPRESRYIIIKVKFFYFNDNSDTSPRSSSSTPVPPTKLLTSLPPKKRRKISKSEEADEAIVKTLQDLHAQRSQQLQEDEEELFGKSVGAALRRMSL